MRFLLAPLTQKTLSQVFQRNAALMDPNNGGAASTLQPKTGQFPMTAFRDQFLESGMCGRKQECVLGVLLYERCVCISGHPVRAGAGRRAEDE